MEMMKTIIRLGVIMSIVLKLAMAANYTVGGPIGGWDTTTDLQTWATSQSFLVGDNLIFQYGPTHNVFEVSKADYDSCQISNPIQTHSGSNTLIPLSSPGKRHFICGTAGHCSQGMKVEIDVLATTTPSPPTASPTSPPPLVSPFTDPPVSSPSPKTTALSPSQPQLFPKVSPSSSPTSFPSPNVSLPPLAPSSANRDSLRASLTMGFSLVIMMLMGI
ncbi:uclacyanin 1-like [Jatropha curcas]|uniref:uclacyanin 1-like n=1 Tax=Jatropha curcas TaxID=180498 RepID=UPI0005FBE77D|nr:uclacyanin 1-like [Jatropha curcas]